MARRVDEKYPHLLASESSSGYTAGVSNFEIYLRAELETYSKEVMDSLLKDVSKAAAEGRNLLQETYTRLFQQIGYDSLEKVEEEELS